MSKPYKVNFKIEIPLQRLIDDEVAKAVLKEVQKWRPSCNDENKRVNDDRSALFDALFEETMLRMQIALKVPLWPVLQLPAAMKSTLIIQAAL